MEWILLAALVAVGLVCQRLCRRLAGLEATVKQQQAAVDSAAELLSEQSLRQQEAERAERLFREGLQNILNYGVK